MQDLLSQSFTLDVELLKTLALWVGLLLLLRRGQAVGRSADANMGRVDLEAQGQLNERFSEAVKLFANQEEDRVVEKMGGLYSLEEISTESPRYRSIVACI